MATDVQPLPPAPRFEELLGRFFDGQMEDAEDRAFAEMLARDPALARQFLEQLSIEGMVAGLLGGRRAEDAAFAAGVRRAVELTRDESETRHFAQRVVALVRRSRRPRRGRAMRKGASDKILGLPPAVLGMACAAAILLVALLAWNWGSTQPRKEPEVVKEPPPAPAHVVLARLSSVDGFEAEWDRAGVHSPAKAGDEIQENDRLVITAAGADVRSSTKPPAVEAKLRDGSMLIFSGPAALRFGLRGNVLAPLLEHGEVRVKAAPQLAARALVVRTQQGPEAAVLGTVFRLHAEPDDRRVTLEVEEGKVRFASQGAEQTVSADLACVSLDGAPPCAPFAFRAAPARLAGKALDAQSGAPVAGASVRVITLARRRSDFNRDLAIETTADGEGNFRFDALQEGPAAVFVKTDKGGRALHSMGGYERILLKGGEEARGEVKIHKLTLLLGVITEAPGKAISDCEVQALPEGSDGLVPRYTFSFKYPAHEFRTAVFHGAGTYDLQIEKRGHVVRTAQAPRIKVQPDIAGALMIFAKLEPSATVRGRVLDAATTLPLADEGDAYAPRSARTILTLTLPNGRKKMLVPEADGSFVFDTALEAGNFELKAERFGCAAEVLRFDLASGQAVEKDIVLRRAELAERK